MWISKREYDALVAARDEALRGRLAAELRVTLLERSLATSQANVDWLRVLANNLSADRAALGAARGIPLPAPEIAGHLQTAADLEARARMVEAGGGPTVEALGRAMSAGDVDQALAAYTDATAGFEDVGDEAAEAAGIQHADDGTVAYSK